MFEVETQKLKKIVKNMFFFVMKSGEIKKRSPFSTDTDQFYCLEAPGSFSVFDLSRNGESYDN